MNFFEQEVDSIDLADVNEAIRLVSEYLCGEKYYKKDFSSREMDLLSSLVTKIRDEGINYEQFNEFLLLLNQYRVNKAFFKFFFQQDRIKWEDLKAGITRFRGFAMLCFGNFRFAYKQLIEKDNTEIEKCLEPYCRINILSDEYANRPTKALEICKVDRDKTWFNGYIAKKKYEKEAELLSDQLQINREQKLFTQTELLKLGEMYAKMGQSLEEVEQTALKNTDIYLTWDYMDVYVATSMRNRWEFEDIFDFINLIFSNEKIKNLNLRFFDPTQSQCENRIDKGLIEGLMLKRAKCTIYMAQETDTMGKDSELASTLAQRKPVIAYVPLVNIDEHTEKLKRYPLDYFKSRFYVLQAEGTLSDEKCINEIKEKYDNFEDKINNFISELDQYRSCQPFSLWVEREEKFKQESKYFFEICGILAFAERYSYNKRADTIMQVHPLGVQVDLQSGVANGVLVVRNVKDCCELLYQLLTNSVSYEIKHIRERGNGIVKLEEKISKCAHRVVTEHEKLSNSFWNFYLKS